MIAKALALFTSSLACLTAQQIASVQITRTPAGPVVPADFIGFSFQQSAALSFFGPATAGNTVLFNLIRNLGKGTLRIGGAAADYSCWSGAPAPNPALCQYSLTSTDFASWSAASSRTGWPMLLGLNLVQNSSPGAPQYILDEVTQGIQPVLKRYPKSSLLGFELGNELNLYPIQGYRPPTYGVPGQITDLLDYITVLKANASTAAIGLAAPAYYDPSVNTVVAQLDPVLQGILECDGCSSRNLGLVTLHEYPLNNASGPVTIQQLLSPTLIAQVQQNFTKAVSDAHTKFQLQVQIGETNSVSPDPGQSGVSDVQASAIWALDYALEMAQIGVRRMNFHFHEASLYDPVSITNLDSGAFSDIAEPEYYGLYAFNPAKGGQFLPVTVSAESANIRAYALSPCTNCAVTIYLINKDLTAAGTVQLGLSASGTSASYLQLTAPSLMSTAPFITYGGAQFSSTTGALSGPVQSTPVSPDGNGHYTIPLPSATVTIVTVQP